MGAVNESKYLVIAGMDDVPHIPKDVKESLERNTLPHLRDARLRGIPTMGAGAIYQYPPETITVDPFQIPPFWRRFYGMDVGWKNTSVAWFAHDIETDTLYMNSVYVGIEKTASQNASAIRARGEWMHGVVDPAANGRAQKDGEQLMQDYISLGLNLHPANNSVEAGIMQVSDRLEQSRLKIFSTCRPYFMEYRLYRRDERGQIVKKMDHLMDAKRYGVVSGIHVGKTKPLDVRNAESARGSTGAADSLAGY